MARALARVRRVAVGAAVLALLVGQALPAEASTTVRGTCTFTWSPSNATVAKGARVTWKAVSCGPHTVTSYSANWSKNTTISTGTSTSRVFQRKGVFKYRCTFHSSLSGGVCSGMCGKVTVR
ncbi:MAG TPA: plastocyanin/azurin family copper-binding protein [Actinomycetota bacterium]|nr:plastocyanin/azurin family copper-binding protein [Actinomycetota bacterium]